MENPSRPTGSTWQEDDIRPILSICERYLRRGDYTTCRDYAVKAQISNPNHPGPVQILAICTILAAASSTTRPDWYSILHLPKFSDDETAIDKNFNLLSDLVNPKKNPFPMAERARDSVFKAWAILSEPSMKTLVDRELRMEEKGEKWGETFWTRCPKCCYFYEYEKKYKDYFLRCQNVKCRSAFKAEPLSGSAAPPAEVVNRDVYVCYGFAPAGRGRERGGGKEGWRWWASPYLSSCCHDKGNKANVMGEEVGLKNEKGGGFVDISDNLKEDKSEVKTEVEDRGCSAVVNREQAKVDSVEENNGGENLVKKRKKMMARTRKKVAGRGTSVSMNEIFSEASDNEADMEVEGGEDSKDYGGG